MKKIMIALATVVFAIGAQAATANWGSGAFFRAAGTTGGWNTSASAIANNMAVTMTAYYIDADTYTALQGYSQSELVKYIADNSLVAKGSAENKNASTGKTTAVATFVDSTAAASTTYYAILTAEYTDADYGDMYMAAVATASVSATGTGTAANIFGGTTSGGVRNWQAAAVPEPTSGLLMLVGLAGLALRRRRA